MTPLRWFLAGVAACLAVIGIGLLVFAPKPSPAVIAQPAPELKGEATTTLTCKPIVIYRDKVAKDLGVPDAPNRHVVAATRIAGDEHPHTVTAVFNDKSGEVTQFVRRDPLPWLALINQIEVGAAYGIKSGHDGFVARLDGQWDLLQIKALKGGLYGQADSDGVGMIGVRAHIKF